MVAGSKTLAVILGAHEWEKLGLERAPAFKKSAEYFLNYLCSSRGLKLPPINVLNLFDDDLQPGQIDASIRHFIVDRNTDNKDITDLIIYYVGHGFYLKDSEYFLAIRATSSDSRASTAFKISYLKDILIDLAPNMKTLVILDACFSSGAIVELSQLGDTIRVMENSFNFVRNRTVLFCAAAAKEWAISPPASDFTMFSGSLLHILEKGHEKGSRYLCLRDVAQLVNEHIRATFGNEGVPAQIHVPYQDLRDLTIDPYFPNCAYPISDVNDRMDEIYDRLEVIEGKLRLIDDGPAAGGEGASSPHDGFPIGETAWCAHVIAQAEAYPSGLRNLALTSLHKLHGGHGGRPQLTEYVVDNILHKMCGPKKILAENQMSAIFLRKSKVKGHFQWEERKSLDLYSPNGEGEERIHGDTSFLVHEDQVNEAISQMEFTIRLERNTIFSFSRWWKKNQRHTIKADDSFTDDEATASYTNGIFTFNYEKREATTNKVAH